MRIVVDPGHSGPVEPGACAGGIKECDVVLAIGKILASELHARGHAVLLTRTGAIHTDGLAFRAEVANSSQADLFISIHANRSAGNAAYGKETYCYPGSGEGRRLAECIQQRLSSALGADNRGVKEADFQVLRETVCPAVLVEVAFISNSKERELLTAYVWQRAAAFALADGVEEYVRVIFTKQTYIMYN